MNRLLTGARKLPFYYAAVLAVSLSIAFVAGSRIVRSQNPASSPETKEGKTRPALIVPGNTTNAGEVIFKPDRDHDGMPDEDEARNGTNPDDPADADADNDGDGLTNGDEVAVGTDPNNADSDGDGASDGTEASQGYSPTDPNNTPPPSPPLASLQVTPNPVNISLNTLLGQPALQLRVIGVRADGTTVDLTGAAGVTYQSLDESVVLVDGTGNVAGVDGGTTTIRVTSGSASIDVTAIVTSMTPAGLGAINIPGYANNVDASGDYAYVAAGSAGLVVVDVHDPRNPVIVATFDTAGNANDVRIVGTTAYIADGPTGLLIIDVGTPTSPSLLGSLALPGEANDVVIYGARAYVASGSAGLFIVDVSNPAAPALIGAVDTPGTAKGVDVSGDLVVVADNDSVVIVDAAVPATPQIVGSAVMTGGGVALDVEVRDRFAYVAAFTAGMQVVDFSAPARPQFIGGITDIFFPRDIALARRYAVAADVRFVNAVPIIDLGDPGDPLYSGIVNFQTLGDFNGTGIAVDDRRIFMTASTDAFNLDNGTTGSSRLFIGEYQAPELEVGDTAGIAPSAIIDSPLSGQSFTEGFRLPISIRATDDVRVALVQLIVNGVVVVRDVSFPYNITYIVPHGGSPTLTIEARAFDVAGNASTSPPVTINVLPDPPPTITIVSPAENQQLTEGQDLFLFADASDNSSLSSVVFQINGETLQNFSSFVVPSGINTLTVEATATDDFGNTASTTRTLDVVPDPPPTLSIISPAEGTQLTEGQSVEFVADASDNIFVDHVEFNINGTVFTDFQAPYKQSYTVPAGTSSLALTVAATDNLGRQTEATRTFTVVPDPGTTVTGRVVDSGGQPLAGATVTIFDQFIAQSGADGSFSLANVSTVRGEILARVTSTVGGKSAANASVPTAPVAGGTTDVGTIGLSVAPTAPTAFSVADYDGDFVPDIFVGYPDRQSRVYSFSGSQFIPSTSVLLPFGAVSSGANLDLNFDSQHEIFAQLAGQTGLVRDVSFDGGVMQTPFSVQTGLAGESQYTAVALDAPPAQTDSASRDAAVQIDQLGASAVHSQRTILAFLKNSSGGTSLTVRFGNDAETGFDDPVAIPVDPAIALRSLVLADINHDGWQDVLVIKPLTGTDASLVVYLRTSHSTFADPIESPVTIRAAVPARGAVDFVTGKFGGNFFQTDVAMLADGGVRIYQGDGQGGFTPGQQVSIPAGQIVSGLTASDITRDGRSDLVVTANDAGAPETRYAFIYFNTFDGIFQSPTVKTYTAPISAGDSRATVGQWGGSFSSLDLVVVDGENITIFFDVGPVRHGS